MRTVFEKVLDVIYSWRTDAGIVSRLVYLERRSREIGDRISVLEKHLEHDAQSYLYHANIIALRELRGQHEEIIKESNSLSRVARARRRKREARAR